MSDARTPAEKLDNARDAAVHAAWELVNEQDPHRIHITPTERAAAGLRPLNDQERKAYLDWHRSRRHALLATANNLDHLREVVGQPTIDRPSLRTAIAHHDAAIDRIRSQNKPARAPKAKQPKPIDPTARHAREIHAYAVKHGLSDRQAAKILKGTRWAAAPEPTSSRPSDRVSPPPRPPTRS